MNLDRRLRLAIFFLHIGVAVILMVVSGQPTTNDDFEKSEIGKLIDMVEVLREESANAIRSLQSQLTASVEEIAKLKTKGTTDEQQRGANYIRWGRKTCENNATIVYKGYAAGPKYNLKGSASNYLCLHEDPQWKTYINGGASGTIYGVEYELFNSGPHHNNVFSETNNGGNPLLDKPAPCAVCYVGGRSTILMIPARTQCPDGWTTEYQGYLVSDRNHVNHFRTSYICWDEAPEVAVGGTSQNQAIVYPVKVYCGSLPCSVYTSGRQLTCVVCSK